ncbi:hypothetical protein [Streptomyces chartreusis]
MPAPATAAAASVEKSSRDGLPAPANGIDDASAIALGCPLHSR